MSRSKTPMRMTFMARPPEARMSMNVQITSHFAFTLDQPTSTLLQFEAAAYGEQAITESALKITPTDHFARVPAHDGVGERIWLNADGKIEVEYRARVRTNRRLDPMRELAAVPLHKLPGEAVQYLLDSRYCQADEFQGLVATEFSGTVGGARIDAIRAWIAEHFEYVPGSSDTTTDAAQSFIKRQGICRDYAHVLVTLARASSIPARYVACYAPGVTPQDFHAVAEVFLADPLGTGGKWHLVDATGMADLANAAVIGVGRDAADVSFVTSFAPMVFHYSKVSAALTP